MPNGWFKKTDTIEPKETAPVIAEAADRNERRSVPPTLETLDHVYEKATVKPPKITYGIQKVAEMANSPHLGEMSPEFKRKALMMALEAADTNEGQVLNDLVIRQRALKEYEDSFQEQLDRYEAAQAEQNRAHQAELDKITSQFQARIQANLDDVERRHRGFRAWQENKRQELQRFTEAAALCVPQEKMDEPEPISNVMPMLRPTGTANK